MSKKTLFLNNREINLVNDYLRQNDESGTLVTHHLEPDSLRQKIDLSLPECEGSLEEVYAFIEQYLTFAVRTSHKQFFNQLWSGLSLPGFLGELFTCLTSTSMYTYEAAPAATLMEEELIKRFGALCGYADPDGLFISGGSSGNLQAMMIARNLALPALKKEGFNASVRLTAFVSEECHYSFEKNANVLGIGMANIHKVKTSVRGQILPLELDSAIEKSFKNGERPFFIGATSGTTVKGAYDPLEEISAVAQKHNLWFHVDGSFGGSVLLSPRLRGLLKGIDKADSFVCNAHKLMGIPLMCTFFLTKEKGHLLRTNSVSGTDYIYHNDVYGEYDLGKFSLQCGRKVDALKIWLTWKYFGDKGFAKKIEHLFDLAGYAEERVNKNHSLELLVPRSSFNICFRYLPAKRKKLNPFNLELRETLARSGKTLVNFAYLDRDLAIRLVITNPELNESDIDYFFDNLIETAKSIDT